MGGKDPDEMYQVYFISKAPTDNDGLTFMNIFQGMFPLNIKSVFFLCYRYAFCENSMGSGDEVYSLRNTGTQPSSTREQSGKLFKAYESSGSSLQRVTT